MPKVLAIWLGRPFRTGGKFTHKLPGRSMQGLGVWYMGPRVSATPKPKTLHRKTADIIGLRLRLRVPFTKSRPPKPYINVNPKP